jgi:sulfatase maturation enzyme AslB (radical SAM superfamily)
MEQSHLKLREIVWEITKKCNNNCWYCGSKERTKEIDTITNQQIKRIIDQICSYPPEEITISGGDPLLVDIHMHRALVDQFKKNNIVPKIIINPKSFMHHSFEIIELYDVIGISINDENDLQLFEELKTLKFKSPFVDSLQKITIITNFNIKNLYSFDKIKKFVKDNNFGWQIQYTVFKEEDNPLAIYNDDNAFLEFDKKVCESIKERIKVVVSDNANFNSCFAGKSVLGITAEGNVLPCLSIVSWEDEKSVIQGNLLERDLKDIWETEFQQYRFGDYKCCKDHCKRKAIVKYESKIVEDEEKSDIIKEFEKFIKPELDKIKRDPIIAYYGVQQPHIMMYGVFREPIVVAYAVTGETTSNKYDWKTMHPVSAYGVFNTPSFFDELKYEEDVSCDTLKDVEKEKSE